MENTKTIRLIIESRLENVFLVGLAVQSYCMYSPLSEREAYHVRLCVVEALNHSILHAYQSQPGHEVEVTVSIHRDRISLRVCDSGRKMEPPQKPDVELDPEKIDSIEQAGVGLHVIRSLMDKVDFQGAEGKNEIKMTKSFGGRLLDE